MPDHALDPDLTALRWLEAELKGVSWLERGLGFKALAEAQA